MEEFPESSSSASVCTLDHRSYNCRSIASTRLRPLDLDCYDQLCILFTWFYSTGILTTQKFHQYNEKTVGSCKKLSVFYKSVDAKHVRGAHNRPPRCVVKVRLTKQCGRNQYSAAMLTLNVTLVSYGLSVLWSGSGRRNYASDKRAFRIPVSDLLISWKIGKQWRHRKKNNYLLVLQIIKHYSRLI